MNQHEVGFRICPAGPVTDPATVEALGALETVYLSDAMNKFNAMDCRVRPVISGTRLAGRALTVRPAPGDNLAVYMALEQAQPHDVLVIESRGLTEVAQWGDLTSTVGKAVGLSGAVMDGSVRDREGIIRVGLPVFAAPEPVATGGTRTGPGELNVVVAVGGVAVCPGDIVVGDDNGIVVIPSANVDGVLDRARRLADADADKMRTAATGTGSLGWLGDAVRAAGYPV